MFYSRPRIEPLGWDLVALPTPDGSRNFAALTSEGHPVDFRFSSGWLTVERGEAGASPEDSMNEVLSMQISPFGIVDICPAQLCDVLGLTVRGHPVSVSRVIPARGFDWSGQTTYWCSTHSMMLRDDAELLAAKICGAFQDAVILQPTWLWQPPRVRCRQVKFLMPSDEIATFAIGCDAARLDGMLVADAVPLEEFESIRYPRIDLWRVDSGEDLTGSSLIREKGAQALELDYEVIRHRRYRIWVEYETKDERAHAIMQDLLQVFESHFSRGFEVVNLQTGMSSRRTGATRKTPRAVACHSGTGVWSAAGVTCSLGSAARRAANRSSSSVTGRSRDEASVILRSQIGHVDYKRAQS